MVKMQSSHRKRKLSKETIINVSDDEALSSNEVPDAEVLEKNIKIRHVDIENSNQESSDLEIVEVEAIEKPIEVLQSSEHLFDNQDIVLLYSQPSNESLKEDSDVEVIEVVPEPLSGSLDQEGSSNILSLPILESGVEGLPIVVTQDAQDSNSNANFCLVNSEYINVEHISKLREEIEQLKAENEQLHSKPCTCIKLQDTTDSKSELELIATINFNNIEDYNFYKNEFVSVFQSALKFHIKENEADRVIQIFKDDIDISDWVVVDDADVIKEKSKKTKHKKKKKKRDKSENDLFVLDTTPFYSANSNMQYESKFSVTLNNPSVENEQKSNQSANCFNCNNNHNLRDCPRPKNYMKINAARQKFKGNQNKALRYHLEEDQRFSHLKPGKISDKLKEALGLRDDQLPPHIYKMRQLGYPPGWFDELQIAQGSELVLFDFEGKNDFKTKHPGLEIDPDKVIEYPGFNVPMDKGVRDEYRVYGCPQYSKENSKHKMLEYARTLSRKAKDNLESCDMDVEDHTSPKSHHNTVAVRTSRPPSPTLTELEKAKKKLLSELIDANDDSIGNCTPVPGEDSTVSEDGFKTLDATGTPEELCTMVDENQPSSPSSNKNLVKLTSFGTPIISSLSPFCKLPKPENFQQNVSDVINFENLPNSTGKYEQMVGVLEKVRTQLKRLNSS